MTTHTTAPNVMSLVPFDDERDDVFATLDGLYERSLSGRESTGADYWMFDVLSDGSCYALRVRGDGASGPLTVLQTVPCRSLAQAVCRCIAGNMRLCLVGSR